MRYVMVALKGHELVTMSGLDKAALSHKRLQAACPIVVSGTVCVRLAIPTRFSRQAGRQSTLLIGFSLKTSDAHTDDMVDALGESLVLPVSVSSGFCFPLSEFSLSKPYH